MAENHIAKPEDFRQAAEARKSDDAQLERVVLPKSGYAVVLRRPAPMWFLFHGHLPLSLAARHHGGGESPGRSGTTTIQTAEEFVEFSRWMVDLLTEVFVGPKLSLNPGPNEISPEWLDEDDVNFIIRWAVGEVTADAGVGSKPAPATGHHDLARFRGEPRPAAAGAGGGNVSLPAQPAPAGDDDGAAD